MVFGVFELVAAFASTAAELTFAAVDPPTAATVLATDPEPLAVTSPVSAVICAPAGLGANSTIVAAMADTALYAARTREPDLVDIFPSLTPTTTYFVDV
jgi:hypothetical protein